MEIKTDSEAKFYRELLARKYAQSSIETYISCLRVIRHLYTHFSSKKTSTITFK
jgi:hypothetical protein